MREWTSWIASLVLLIATVRYCYLIYQGHIRSSPAGWAIAAIAGAIGYIAYWQTPDPTWLGNLVQFIGTVEIWIVLGFLSWTLHCKDELRVEFDRFQKGCLLSALGIAVLWTTTNRPDVAFFLIQALLVLSYVALVGKVISWKRNLDYVPMWVAILIASSIGSVPAWMDGDTYGIINSFRAALCSAITVGIMLRIEAQTRKHLQPR